MIRELKTSSSARKTRLFGPELSSIGWRLFAVLDYLHRLVKRAPLCRDKAVRHVLGAVQCYHSRLGGSMNTVI
jgi:hypothetical protein